MSNNGSNPYGYGPPPPSSQNGYQQQQHQPPVQYFNPPAIIVNAPVRTFNHTPHLIITILTCGAWFPFWMLIWALS